MSFDTHTRFFKAYVRHGADYNMVASALGVLFYRRRQSRRTERAVHEAAAEKAI